MALRAFNGFVSLQEELEAQTYNEETDLKIKARGGDPTTEVSDEGRGEHMGRSPSSEPSPWQRGIQMSH